MVHAGTNNITRFIDLFFLAFVSTLLIPFSVLAEPETLPCTNARLEIKHTQNILRPMRQHRQQLQEEVESTYQQLFVCQTDRKLSLTQQQHCTELQKEGPKQFQAIVTAIILSHQTSQLLANQSLQAQLACPVITERTSHTTTEQLPHHTISRK